VRFLTIFLSLLLFFCSTSVAKAELYDVKGNLKFKLFRGKRSYIINIGFLRTDSLSVFDSSEPDLLVVSSTTPRSQLSIPGLDLNDQLEALFTSEGQNLIKDFTLKNLSIIEFDDYISGLTYDFIFKSFTIIRRMETVIADDGSVQESPIIELSFKSKNTSYTCGELELADICPSPSLPINFNIKGKLVFSKLR
jgi:hypothetical protein